MESTQRPLAWIAPVPNILSGARLVFAALFPLLPDAWRLPVLVAGALTDLLDGQIARQFHAKSVAGGLLDAVADKLFVLSILLTLAADGQLPWWSVPLVLVRDLTIGYVALHTALRRDWAAFREMPPRIGGKATTVCQFGLFLTVIAWQDPTAVLVVLALTIATGVLAAADYLLIFIRALAARRRRG
ncbi:MAG: CDP-alcohol phosphatidyltransferase family protein [Planctomycetota bacterium]